MPAYVITVVHTLRIVGTLTLTARSEEAAQAQAERLADQGRFGSVAWSISGHDQRIDEWDEEESNVVVEEITEE